MGLTCVYVCVCVYKHPYKAGRIIIPTSDEKIDAHRGEVICLGHRARKCHSQGLKLGQTRFQPLWCLPPHCTAFLVERFRYYLCQLRILVAFPSLDTLCMLHHFSCVQLFATPWTVACQAPLSMGFSRQEYWSGLPCPPPGDLPDTGIEPASPATPALRMNPLPMSYQGSPDTLYSLNTCSLHFYYDYMLWTENRLGCGQCP